IAVDVYRALTQSVHVHGRSQAASDQTLYLTRAPGRGFAAPIALFTALRVGARMHLVFCGNPPATCAFEESRHAIIDARGRQNHLALASIQHRTLRSAMETMHDFNGSGSPRIAAWSTI